MPDLPISGFPAATLPLTGAEKVPLVQGGVSKQATLLNIQLSIVYTVATLPSAVTAGVGRRAFVTDHLGPVVFGSTPTGGGTSKLPVYSDGAFWYLG